MLTEDPYIHADLGSLEVGPSPAQQFKDDSHDVEVQPQCPTTLLPESPKLSKWLQISDGSDDSDESYDSERSQRSEESEESDGNDSDEADELDDFDESDGVTTDNDIDKPWTPPIVKDWDMKFRIDGFAPAPLMSVEEHIERDKHMVHIYTTFKKTWPTPEDVMNDVEIATTMLSLLIQTTCRTIPLRIQWMDVMNLHLFAEQTIVREHLAEAVRWQKFMVLRTLRLWYEGYD